VTVDAVDRHIEPQVFESKTRPGSWFWLSATGTSGWAADQAEAEHLAGLNPAADA
jgi:hypothetical protein